MKIDLTQFRQTFLQESADHIATMEAALLELRSSPDDPEILNGIFRSAHSIKGGAGSFGLENLAHFTHALESLLDRLRAMEIDPRFAANNTAHDRFSKVVVRLEPNLHRLGRETPRRARSRRACKSGLAGVPRRSNSAHWSLRRNK